MTKHLVYEDDSIRHIRRRNQARRFFHDAQPASHHYSGAAFFRAISDVDYLLSVLDQASEAAREDERRLCIEDIKGATGLGNAIERMYVRCSRSEHVGE